MKVKIHKDCGGRIVKGRCRKCGQKWGFVGSRTSREIKLVNIEPEPTEKLFSAREYRKRIRDGKDIPGGGKD